MAKNEETLPMEMKIAWRYQSMPTVSSGDNNSADPFDYGNHISEETLVCATIDFADFDTCYEVLQRNSSPSTVTRLILYNLGSPMSNLKLSSIPKFIYDLKSICRKLPNVSCLITMPMHLILSSPVAHIRNRIHTIVDCVIQLIAFTENSKTPYTEYSGLFNILKLPTINSLNYYFVPETFDIGYQLKRNDRFFIVDKLCLPPDLGETPSRTTCSTVNKKLEF